MKSLVPTVRPTVRQSIELITASKTMLSIGLTGEEPGVSEDYVVELAQDEQKKISVVPAVFVQESFVEEQPGSRAAFNARGFRCIAELDIKQSEELLHFIGRRGQ